MPDTVSVTLEVEPGAAEALGDARRRVAIGQLINRVLDPSLDNKDLAQAVAETLVEARTPGLIGPRVAANDTAPADLVPPSSEARAAAGLALAAEFRQLRRGQTLGGLRIRDLIEEGRR